MIKAVIVILDVHSQNFHFHLKLYGSMEMQSENCIMEIAKWKCIVETIEWKLQSGSV